MVNALLLDANEKSNYILIWTIINQTYLLQVKFFLLLT